MECTSTKDVDKASGDPYICVRANKATITDDRLESQGPAIEAFGATAELSFLTRESNVSKSTASIKFGVFHG